MPTATLTAKGQLTLPRAVRELWDLAPGDQVDFVIDAESGRVELRPLAARAREAFGMLYRADRPARSLEEMDAARDAALVEDERRIRDRRSAGEADGVPGYAGPDDGNPDERGPDDARYDAGSGRPS